MRTEKMKVEIAIEINSFSSTHDVNPYQYAIGKPFTVSHINQERSGSGGSVVLIDTYGERHIFSLAVFSAAFVEVKP